MYYTQALDMQITEFSFHVIKSGVKITVEAVGLFQAWRILQELGIDATKIQADI